MSKDARVACSGFDGSKNPLGLGLGSAEDVKVWEDTRCPICMENPHNARILRCSSFEKGCRPFMCNTSYRHSNCFDQFCKSSAAVLPEIPLTSTCRSWRCQSPKLLCPLCRGEIYGWTLVEAARQFMDNRARSCSSETCDFSGTYRQLRKHARSQHPNVRPTEVDSKRQTDWTRFELLRDYEDAQLQFELSRDYEDAQLQFELLRDYEDAHIQPASGEESPSEDSDSGEEGSTSEDSDSGEESSTSEDRDSRTAEAAKLEEIYLAELENICFRDNNFWNNFL
ncbi:hypothetical protein V6N13_089863 [Hibiscus sabdariffa]